MFFCEMCPTEGMFCERCDYQVCIECCEGHSEDEEEGGTSG
jgi:hypothetical protein